MLASLLLGLGTGYPEEVGSDLDKDPATIAGFLQEAQNFAENKKPEQAVKKCDQVIESFRKRYKDSTQVVYCSRSSTETLAYLFKAAFDKQNAIAISPTWADAHYVKAYALQDMGRIPEAKENLRLALELSPFNSAYLSELGHLLQSEKDWTGAKKLFKEAEEHVTFSPEERAPADLARARRGFAYCLIEEGKLNEAEAIYRKCLEADPDDKRSIGELDYIRKLRAKGS